MTRFFLLDMHLLWLEMRWVGILIGVLSEVSSITTPYPDEFSDNFPTPAEAAVPKLNEVSASCPCGYFGCIHREELSHFKRLGESFAQLVKNVLDAEYSPDMLPPYVGVGPMRDDVCSLGRLEAPVPVDYFEDLVQVVAEVRPMSRGIRGTKKRRRDSSDEDLNSAVLISYATDCLVREQAGSEIQHPLIRQFIALSFLNNTGITPKVYYLSPPAQLGPGIDHSLIPSFMADWIDTFPGRNATVRFMVQELEGGTLSSFARSALSLPTWASGLVMIFKIVRSALDKLEKLHSMGLIHGAISEEAITIDFTDDDEAFLTQWDDFVFFAKDIGQPLNLKTETSDASKLSTPWWFGHQRAGPRDDVFQLLLSLANILSRSELGPAIDDYVDATIDESGITIIGSEALDSVRWNAYRTVYQEMNFFTPNRALATQAFYKLPIPPALKWRLQNELDTIVTAVRSIWHPDMRPPYRMIRDYLDRITAAISVH